MICKLLIETHSRDFTPNGGRQIKHTATDDLRKEIRRSLEDVHGEWPDLLKYPSNSDHHSVEMW